MSKKRWCGYCGKPDCRCGYRAKRSGGISITVHNTSAQTTMGEMREEFLDTFKGFSDDRKGFWSISFTAQDETKVAAAYAKAASSEAE